MEAQHSCSIFQFLRRSRTVNKDPSAFANWVHWKPQKGLSCFTTTSSPLSAANISARRISAVLPDITNRGGGGGSSILLLRAFLVSTAIVFVCAGMFWGFARLLLGTPSGVNLTLKKHRSSWTDSAHSRPRQPPRPSLLLLERAPLRK